MRLYHFLLALLLPLAALAQAPVQRTPFTTNVTAGPVVSPAWLHAGSVHVTTNISTPSLDVTNNAKFQNVTASKLAVFDANKYLTNSTLTDADIPTIPKNTMVGTNATQYRVPMTGDTTSTNYVAGPIVSDASATNANALGTVTAYMANITNNAVVGTGTSPGTTMVDIGPSPAGTNAVWINGGVQTVSSPPLTISETMNNAAVTFSEFNVVSTNTASGANSLFADFRSGAAGSVTSRLGIRLSDGALMIPSTGAFILDDSGATAGNARGNHAVDLQFGRNAATKVASGASSFCAGTNNTASGTASVAMGQANIATGNNSLAVGGTAQASATSAIALGASTIASGTSSTALGSTTFASGTYSIAAGFRSSASHQGEVSLANGRFSLNGDAQTSLMVISRSVTAGGGSGSGNTNTWSELFLDGDGSTARMTMPSTNSVWTFRVQIVGKATTAGVDKGAGWTIEGVIKKTTTTTSIVGSTTVTKLAADDATWDARASANDTNDSLLIEVYSDVEPSRWVATVTLTQVMAP